MIPFNKPYVPELSKQYALEVLESNHQQGDGPYTTKASKLLSDLVGGGHVLLTPSCTHALEMASMLADIGPGDEVILPSYTFTSAATAITQFGATPVFVDIDPVTKGIDANQVAEAVTSKTKAISWVNYAGVAPDIDALQSIATNRELLLIEDNAHGLGGSYKGKPLGSFGDFATQSFHATKNIQCGEGGALILNNKNFIERAEVIREKGTDRSKFMDGQVKKYQWVDKGSSYLLAEILAALLLGQLQDFETIQERREFIWASFAEGILPTSRFQLNATDNRNVAHMFFMQMSTAEDRDDLQKYLLSNEIIATSHYQPLSNSIAGFKFGKYKGNLVNSQKTSETLIRLPLWFDMQENSIVKIIQSVNNFGGHN